MSKIKHFWGIMLRNLVWLTAGAAALYILKPKPAEIHTILLIVVVECIAVALSGLAVFAYTKIDFTHDEAKSNLGYIFLGVHVCVGLVVLGVYIAQFAN